MGECLKSLLAPLENIKSRSIGVVSAYSYGPEFDALQDLKKLVCKDTQELLRILRKERIEIAATQDVVYTYIGKSLGYPDEFKVVYVVGERGFYPVFSRVNGKNGVALAEKFGRTIRLLKKEGMIQKITDNYLSKLSAESGKQ